ncbi:MAG: dITP/XTP pyrophosphatase [Parcubacteria group bacterium Gr01-1014_20]|nr:MAG: dITP/XTP pyrophosphatase [Parcubacteria group bacterium Gr01-1014_20]
MDIILGTRNPSKAEQIKAMFKGLPLRVTTLSEAGVEGDAIEDGATLKDNAFKKALFAHENTPHGCWAMAEDTGFFINALGGAPGIWAARWAGEKATTNEITAHTLELLKNQLDRSATFETVVAIVSPSGQEHFFTGKVTGQILASPRVPPQPKMPYSGIFVPEGEHQVWAEMTIEYENRISHRGQAFRQARAFFENLIE